MLENSIVSLARFISRAKTKDGKTLIEKTAYKDIAMWWFVDAYFYKFLEQLVKLISPIKDSNTPSLMENRKNFLSRKIRHTPLYNIGFIHALYNFLTALLCQLIIKSHKLSTVSPKKPKILLTAENIEWREIQDFSTKKKRKSDAFFDSLILMLRRDKRYEIVSTYPLYYPVSGLKIAIDKRINQKDVAHKPFNAYWSVDAWREGGLAKKYFSKVWNDLKEDKIFKKSLRYKNLNLFPLLEEELSYYFTTIFGRMVEYIEMAKRLLEQEKPDSILIEEEYGQFERALVVAGKLRGIPTLAIQHGIMTPMYAKNEISADGSTKSPYCPIPDKTAVYGPHFKYLLTEVSAYPENSVVVTGQPRYDRLYYVNKIYFKEEFLKRWKINPDYKIILWLTQCHGLSDEENIKNFKAVFGAFQNIKNASLIIKQHPGESEKYTKIIKKYLNDYKINAIMTPKRSDTYEQLFVCDLMITRYSTTAAEAAALNKPIIILNLSGEPDVIDYVKSGIALGVYDKKDLALTIKKLLKDDSELAKNRQRFIENYLYKIDGKSTERVIKLVEQMINESENKK